jgi:3-oxoadipate enol-lactonase
MSRDDDFSRGERNRRRMLGDAWVDRSLGGADAFNADFQSLVTRYAWHDIWGRPGLDANTRRLLVLGMTMAAARWEEFELHCRAAVRGGVPIEAIRETLMQGAIYCGVPAANTAMKLAREILRDEGVALEPRSLLGARRVQRHHTFSAPSLHVAIQGDEQGAGAGVPVVLSHALGVDLSMWDDLAAQLAVHHPVLRYDHRGHGGSAVPEGPYAMADLVGDAARIVREWGRGPVVFVGLSMGGMVAQGLAIRHPELVRGVVLANTTARQPPGAAAVWAERIAAVRERGMAAVAEATLQRWFTAPFHETRPDVVERVRRTLQRCDVDGYAASCAAVAQVDWLDELHQVRCPALVLAGAHDAGTTPAMGRQIAERIAGARFVQLDDAAHLSVVERPQAFSDALVAWVSQLA